MVKYFSVGLPWSGDDYSNFCVDMSFTQKRKRLVGAVMSLSELNVHIVAVLFVQYDTEKNKI